MKTAQCLVRLMVDIQYANRIKNVSAWLLNDFNLIWFLLNNYRDETLRKP